MYVFKHEMCEINEHTIGSSVVRLNRERSSMMRGYLNRITSFGTSHYRKAYHIPKALPKRSFNLHA